MFGKHISKSLRSGLAYGLGLALGNLFSAFIFNNVSMEWLASEGSGRLILGIILAFVIAGIAGAIGGFSGGMTLYTVRRSRGRWGYAWRSALVFGFGYGLMLFPLGLVISLLGFYAGEEIASSGFGLSMGIFGAIFGLVVGGFLGLITVGLRRALRVLSMSLIGFGLGGAILGLCLHAYLYSVVYGQTRAGQLLWLLLGLFIFGAFGGAFLGFIYSYLSAEAVDAPALPRGALSAAWRIGLIVAVVLVFILTFRPIMSQIRQFLTPQEAELSRVLSTDTFGVRWSAPFNLSKAAAFAPAAHQPDLFVGQDGRLIVAWAQGEEGGREIYYAEGLRTAVSQAPDWDLPVKSSFNERVDSYQPRVVLDRSGAGHLVWVESQPGADALGEIFYSRCQEGVCSQPVKISNLDAVACALEGASQAGNDSPAIRINAQDQIMIVWRNSAGALPYISWQAGQPPPGAASGCLIPDSPPDEKEFSEPGLNVGPDGRFALVFAVRNDIWLTHFEAGNWSAAPENIGVGSRPQVIVDQQNSVYAAWCDRSQLQVWQGGQFNIVADIACASRPELALAGDGRLHILWYGDQVKNLSGRIGPHTILYESIQVEDGWSPPVIVAVTGGFSQPALAPASDGSLHLAWSGNANKQNNLYYASQAMYGCEAEDLSGISQIVYQVAQQAGFRKVGDQIPFCQNKYDQLVFTPNPDPAYSELPPTVNGAFDHMGDLIESAQYEALYATMWYDKDSNQDSPGSVIAQSVASLYYKVKEDPTSYPRGMTVRILLGNPPELAGQLWYLLEDLRNAGVPEMVNPEISWRLEVANYAGKFPHSHVKTLIIDGKTVIAAGYNTTYDHFEIEHFSEQGKGRFDLGLQITGPVAQDSLRVFDDLWVGADRRHCSNFHPAVDGLWQATCYDLDAVGGHAPEVLRYETPDGESIAFSMYRSKKQNESDQQISAALSSAQKSIDLIHVNFTMQLICDLNVLFKVCTAQQSMPYLDSMLHAVEHNQARLRILIKPDPVEGIESLIALRVLGEEVAKFQHQDLIFVRFFEGEMHPKVSLIDDQFLIVGSQNFHYSAFGESAGLNEYSLGVDDPQATEDFKRVFDYYWEISTPLDEYR